MQLKASKLIGFSQPKSCKNNFSNDGQLIWIKTSCFLLYETTHGSLTKWSIFNFGNWKINCESEVMKISLDACNSSKFGIKLLVFKFFLNSLGIVYLPEIFSLLRLCNWKIVFKSELLKPVRLTSSVSKFSQKIRLSRIDVLFFSGVVSILVCPILTCFKDDLLLRNKSWHWM